MNRLSAAVLAVATLSLRLRALGLVVLIVAGATACGGPGDESSPPSNSPGPGTAARLTGVAMHGPIAGATVRVFALNPNGSLGALQGSTTTDAAGAYSVSLTSNAAPMLLEVSGGSYEDEATGNTLSLPATERLVAAVSGGTQVAAITALTNLAASRALELAAAGAPLEEAIVAANAGIGQQYNLANIVTVLPASAIAPPGANALARDYGLVLAAYAQAAKEKQSPLAEFVAALSTDIADGVLDGQDAGVPVPLVSNGTAATLLATDGTIGIQAALNRFLDSARNATGVKELAIQTSAVTIDVAVAAAPGKHVLRVVKKGTAPGSVYWSNAGGVVPPHGSPLLCPGTCSALVDPDLFVSLQTVNSWAISTVFSGDCDHAVPDSFASCTLRMDGNKRVVVTMTGPFGGTYIAYANGNVIEGNPPVSSPLVDFAVAFKLFPDDDAGVYRADIGGIVSGGGAGYLGDLTLRTGANGSVIDEDGVCSYYGSFETTLGNRYYRGVDRPSAPPPGDGRFVVGRGNFDCRGADGSRSSGTWEAYRTGPQ